VEADTKKFSINGMQSGAGDFIAAWDRYLSTQVVGPSSTPFGDVISQEKRDPMKYHRETPSEK
jgi:hypothetical protein